MKKLILLLLFVPLISFGQTKYIVSAKEGLNVREQPSLESKKITTLVYGQKVIIESKTGKKLTINDVDYGYLGRFNIEGEWVEITSETEVKGYVFDGFLEKSNGIWDLNTIIGGGIIYRKEKLIDLTEGNNNWSEIVVANIYYSHVEAPYGTAALPPIGETIQLIPHQKELPIIELKIIEDGRLENISENYKEYWSTESLPGINQKYPSEVVIVYPPIKNLTLLDINKEAYFETSSKEDIKAALDFDGDKKPDLLVEEYCGKGGEINGEFYCELYEGATTIKINNKWFLIGHWSPE